MWSLREELGRVDVTGFDVEAVDGSVGKVDEATLDADSSHLVVSTGPPVLGKKVLVPAGLVTAIDRDDEIVHVDCTADDVKNAPEFDRDRLGDPGYREQVAGYYSSGAAGAASARSNAEEEDPEAD
jgi:hypothetical protein